MGVKKTPRGYTTTFIFANKGYSVPIHYFWLVLAETVVETMFVLFEEWNHAAADTTHE
jgi:hypothetical protein